MMLPDRTWIVEGLVTSLDSAGVVNLAPMGPRVGPEFERLLLRPFPGSQTYFNLQATGQGVFHVTDDVLLLARAAIGQVEPPPPLRPASQVRGWVLADACRSHEFEVESMTPTDMRVEVWVRVVGQQRHRDFLGLNRAKFAVVEAAIQATRLHLLPRNEIEADLERWRTLVEKTGAAEEHHALELLESHIRRFWTEAGS
ncbi:MAG TPA: DUF447 family protein [Gemmatales bacterium]|nr:DUF447 family protein [Gemmatales bacterium]